MTSDDREDGEYAHASRPPDRRHGLGTKDRSICLSEQSGAPAIVYIAGYGRSGSTLLERVLSTHNRILGLGELSCLAEMLSGARDTAGNKYRIDDSDFWKEILDILRQRISGRQDVLELQYRFESWKGLRHLVAAPDPELAERYREYIAATIAAVIEASPDRISFLADSSKSAKLACMRPIALSEICGLDVRVIHLVRDARACMWSYLRGSNYRLAEGETGTKSFPLMRSALGWTCANIAAEATRWRLGRENYHRIRYEDFVTRPRDTLESVAGFLGIDLSPAIRLIEEDRNVPLANQLAGNRSKKDQGPIELDEEWRERLPLAGHALFVLINSFLAARYGYVANSGGA